MVHDHDHFVSGVSLRSHGGHGIHQVLPAPLAERADDDRDGHDAGKASGIASSPGSESILAGGTLDSSANPSRPTAKPRWPVSTIGRRAVAGRPTAANRRPA